jgi:ATP-dependent DNA helicase RecQ
VQDARRAAEWLKRQGIAARPYHADLEARERIEAEQQLLSNDVKALVATVALGMGFDKPDLGFVIHFQRPGSAVAYYQQVGRAGRAVDSAFGILLSGREDDEIQDYFINSAFPPLEVMSGVLRVLGKAGTLTVEEIGAELNYGRRALEKALRLLEVDGAVEHDKWNYSRTANPWQPDAMRYEQVTQRRRAELEEIKRYVEHPGCLMEFLARALDDPAAAPCGKCMNCSGQTQRRSPPADLVQAAVDFLRHDALVLEPRVRWPKPVLAEVYKIVPDAIERYEHGRPKMTIPERLRAREGRVLCMYGDAGWGQEVARGKYQTGIFSEALVTAAAELIQRKWKPEPPPQWVTAVPSRRHAELVRDFAQRLAASLGLPFVPALRQRRETQPQKEMRSSALQLRNVLRAFEVTEAPALGPSGAEPAAAGLPRIFQRLARQVTSTFGAGPTLPAVPVLLVDDMVDSGWTLTLAAVLLQHHGSGPVYPFALAKASPRGS